MGRARGVELYEVFVQVRRLGLRLVDGAFSRIGKRLLAEDNACFCAGVLMWEIFSCGKMPYGRLKNTEVVERVQRGIILEKPKACPKEIYDVSTVDPFFFGDFSAG